MGLGDWILATGQVRKINEATGRRVLVVGRGNRPQWSEVFENNPRIVKAMGRYTQMLRNGGGIRPYIAAKTSERWTWRAWDISPGEIFLSDAEKTYAEPYRGKVLIEPRTKVFGNKDWFPERWQALVDLGEFDFLQAGSPGIVPLRGVRHIPTTTFRQAMAILAVSKAFVGTEGALHHAAAALKVPAVVLYSEFISPEFTGYPTQRNIRHAGKACGARLPCAGCRESMEKISVQEVADNVRAIA